jgi:hypothetical protein
MVQDLLNGVPFRYIPVEHTSDEVDTLLADDIWHPQVAIHDLIDAVEGVLLVYDGIKEYSQGPYILLFASIRLASQNLGCCVI